MTYELPEKSYSAMVSLDTLLFFQKLSKKYSSPQKVQRLLREEFAYNTEKHGESVASAMSTWERKVAHCFEASMLSAAILEHLGYPPLVLSLESKDHLDHVLFVFKEKSGWGAISRSREEGLHGRAPVFRSLQALARSYADPYVDESARLTGYGLSHLDATGTPWRDSPRNLWQAEQHLIHLKHRTLVTSEKRYQNLLKSFKENPPPPEAHWW